MGQKTAWWDLPRSEFFNKVLTKFCALFRKNRELSNFGIRYSRRQVRKPSLGRTV